jgi:intein-encoded DNA endonuclease-like protein
VEQLDIFDQRQYNHFELAVRLFARLFQNRYLEGKFNPAGKVLQQSSKGEKFLVHLSLRCV